MELVIVTGLSGAGKSRAVDALEDIGFYCVDNVPPALISKFAELFVQSKGKISRVALVIDMRGGDLFHGLFDALNELETKSLRYKLLFLDCSDQVLMLRFKETRRRHPLTIDKETSVECAVKKERTILMQARAKADYIIDTTYLSPAQLKERICTLFLETVSDSMMINCMSFGVKHGYPVDADLVFDVRCLPNPFYIDELKTKTGLDQSVRDYVMDNPQAVELLHKITDLIDYSIPLYINEGKSQLVVAIGCTGGKHRSVTFAELIYKHLSERDCNVSVNHRDLNK